MEISCGVGKHIAVIQSNPEDFQTLLRFRQIHMTTVMTGISMVKISVSLLLLRLATKKLYRWFLWGMIGFLIAFTIACMGTLRMITAMSFHGYFH
jgi:predicted cobalt transporter CbtA